MLAGSEASLSDFVPLIGAVALPTIVFVLNIAVRSHSGLPWSAGADLLMLAVLLDATMLSSSDSFKALVQNDELREEFHTWVVGLLFLTLLIWYLVVAALETRLTVYFNSESSTYDGIDKLKAAGCLSLAIVSILLIVSMHLTLFL